MGEVNVVVAYAMVQCVGIRWQCDQLHMEGCDHNVHRKVPFQDDVGVKVPVVGEVIQMEVEETIESGQEW
jgi:hypothetical protein